MLFPSILCVDNFFDDPDKVVRLSKEFKYTHSKQYPGKRTGPLHSLNYEFFNHVNLKISSVFYPNETTKLQYRASTYFEKIKKLEHDGWVHVDKDFKFTAIVYLNKENTAGTSIFYPKDFKGLSINKADLLKYSYFENKGKLPKNKLQQVKKAKAECNNSFQKTFSMEGIYNRLVVFDGNSYHASNPLKKDHERLILISFFKDISLNDGSIKFPVPTMRTI